MEEKREIVRQSSGARSEAIDGRALWLRYRMLLMVIVLSGTALAAYEVARLLFFH